MQQLQRLSPALKCCKLSSASPEAAFGSVRFGSHIFSSPGILDVSLKKGAVSCFTEFFWGGRWFKRSGANESVQLLRNDFIGSFHHARLIRKKND